MNIKSNKIRLSSFIAFSATLVALNCYGDDKKAEKKETKNVTSSVSISVTGPDGKKMELSKINPEVEAALKQALGNDKMVETIMKSIRAAEKTSPENGEGKSSVSVVSSAFIIGPDGKMQKLAGAKQNPDGPENANSTNAFDISKIVEIFAAAIGNSSATTSEEGLTKTSLNLGDIKIESYITDQNGKKIMSFSSGSTSDSNNKPMGVQAELIEIRKELAEQRELLNKISKQLESGAK